MSKLTKGFAVFALAMGALAVASGTAEARWRHHHHHGWGWGPGWGYGYPSYYAGPYGYGPPVCRWVRVYRGPYYGWRRVWRCW